MEILINIGLILAGFILLVKGGDYLVDASVAIAKKFKLSNMVIGLTVIGFGTSAPELLVSTQAALVGSSGLALGNVVGSNIANVALILGITAMIFPIPATKTTLRRDAPFMLLSVMLLVAVALLFGTIERWAGAIFVALLISFVTIQILLSKDNGETEEETKVMSFKVAIPVAIISIAALVFGANILIKGAVGIASQLGVDERIIGLTIVAVGTSLPELFATVMAARKHQTDMALGNIIGSVTFNVLCVVGIASVVCPIQNANVGFVQDYIIMVALSVILLLFLSTKALLERWEGSLLLTAYIAYLVYTVIS